MLEALAAHFRGSAERFRWMGSPFNERLSAACAEAPDVLELAACARVGQPPSFLLFGAVHDLLRERPDSPLARHYPSIAERPLPPEGLFPAFRAFCRERRDEVSAIVRERTVQLTTAGRAALVLPAMAHVARVAGEPLSLIEIGASAGVLTLFDHYRYDYGAGRVLGEPGAPSWAGCEFSGMPPLPREMPRIARRAGIDLRPIDPRSPTERRWLEALLPPDWTEERRALVACLDLRAATPLDMRVGDALDVLPELLAIMPDPVVVLHANCLYQWPAPLHHALEMELGEASRGRTLHRLGLELTGSSFTSALPPPAVTGDPPLTYEIVHTVYRDGDRSESRLASHDGFGRQAVWLA